MKLLLLLLGATCLVRTREREGEVANEYCRLVAETAVSLFIERWPERPWIPMANQLTEKEVASTNGSARRRLPDGGNAVSLWLLKRLF